MIRGGVQTRYGIAGSTKREMPASRKLWEGDGKASSASHTLKKILAGGTAGWRHAARAWACLRRRTARLADELVAAFTGGCSENSL